MKILVFGTFDLLHPGHLNFFQQAKSLGDELTVVVGTDLNVEKIKGSKPQHNQNYRVKNIIEAGIADKVILAPENYDYISLLQEEKPNIIALGYDQKPADNELALELKENHLEIKVVRLKPFQPHKYKTSFLKG
jgi:FAD synthetase